MIEISKMDLKEIKEHRSKILVELKDSNPSIERVNELRTEKDLLDSRELEIKRSIEKRNQMINEVINTDKGKVIERSFTEKNNNSRGEQKMFEENKDLEQRSFQKYLVNGNMNQMTEVEQRSLTTIDTGAVTPKTITDSLITDEKYSDLLHRATVFNEQNAGIRSIPIATHNEASWKQELEEATEASPTLTNIELAGYELIRIMQLSLAASSMSVANFENMLTQLLSNELIETLEYSFIFGTGKNQPTGLQSLTFNVGNNLIETENLDASNLAKAISMMPQKYSRNAIILANNETLYNISQFKGTAEYAYNVSEAATMFMGKEIMPNEHIPSGTVYVVDPKELYVRFSMPIQIESNRNSSFRKAAVDLRAFTVVDAKWNQSAVIKIVKKP